MKLIAKAAGVSAGLSSLFLIVYPICNWITSRLRNVTSFYFSWERHLPFVQAFIIPYLSIDLFFVAAPFIARSWAELRLLAYRMASAILLAAGCFLLFPLKFGFQRPAVNGILGIIFDNFHTMDLPFNQCPSLHVAILIILLDLYFRHSRGLLRIIIGVWFGSILCSTLLTYQHHLIDLIGGFALGMFCLYLFPDQPVHEPRTLNHRVAVYYVAGAIPLFCTAFFHLPWSIVLLWPAMALAMAATGYLALGSSIFRKKDGILPYATRFVLAPLLAGQRISLTHYARQSSAYNYLTDHLWIGRRLSTREANQARCDGVTAVVDLTSESSEPKPFRSLNYLQLPVLDLTAPHITQIDQAVAFIQQNTVAGIVYVHCKAGYSRTAVIAGAFLLATGRADTVQAVVDMLRQARPSIIIRPEAMRALEEYSALRQANSSLSGTGTEATLLRI